MIKKLTCIECPKGCQLEVETDGSHVIRVTGNQCEKGVTYAQQEIEDPRRILTSTILTKGLAVKMLPVRTSVPIPKAKLKEAMDEVKKIRLSGPVEAGTVILRDLLDTGADLIATRRAG